MRIASWKFKVKEKLMIYQCVELHNFEEVIEIQGRDGVLLQRIPEEVRIKLREDAQKAYRRSAGGEIRFVSEWNPIKIRLKSYGGNSKALIYFGDFQVMEYNLFEEEECVIEISALSPSFLTKFKYENYQLPFSPLVWRVIISGHEVHLIEIEGKQVRPPRPDEIPKLKYLAYGTSITQGVDSITPDLSWVSQVGWRLKADVINLGASSAAFCEREITEYIANRSDFNFATLELSVNMLNQGVNYKEFYQKSEYMIKTIAEKNQNKPIFCISLIKSFSELGFSWTNRKIVSTALEYREAIKRIVEQSELENLYYVNGSTLLDGIYGLSYDLLHPGNHGMIQIGERLSEIIDKVVYIRAGVQ